MSSRLDEDFLVGMVDPRHTQGATRVPRSPAFIPPMMAKLVDKLPEGENWTYEVKWDGYRALLLKNRDHVQLRSRNDNNLTASYPTVHATALKLKAETALLDGEIVALDPKGKPNVQLRYLRHEAGSMKRACRRTTSARFSTTRT